MRATSDKHNTRAHCEVEYVAMKIFISYRRTDLDGHAVLFVGRVRDRLAQQFGAGSVFMDIDSIPLGEDFVEYISGQVKQADVVLAVIGPQWSQVMAARAGEESDFVRIEIESALGAGSIRVIPVLAGGASMPGPAGLPESVLPLRRLNALAVDSGRDFHVHMARLIEALGTGLPKPMPGAPTASCVIREAGDTMTGPHGIELVWCPPQTFMMGSAPNENGLESESWQGKETQHRVTLTKGFWIGKYPVTQQQWEAVMGSNPSNFKGPQNPVECVSWNDAHVYLKKLGDVYRLPTEAEWEYACRAVTPTAFCFGNEERKLGEGAWYLGNSESRTHPVGEKSPNNWGIYDMHGNVWEWCADWFQDDLGSAAVTDPIGPAFGAYRVVRGGGWISGARNCRSAIRDGIRPESRDYDQGFRVATFAPPLEDRKKSKKLEGCR